MEREAEEAASQQQQVSKGLVDALNIERDDIPKPKKANKESKKSTKKQEPTKLSRMKGVALKAKQINLGLQGLKHSGMLTGKEDPAELFDVGKGPFKNPEVKAKLFGRVKNEKKLSHNFNLNTSTPLLTHGVVSDDTKSALSKAFMKHSNPLSFAFSPDGSELLSSLKKKKDKKLHKKKKGMDLQSNMGFEKLVSHLGGEDLNDEEEYRRLKLSPDSKNTNKISFCNSTNRPEISEENSELAKQNGLGISGSKSLSKINLSDRSSNSGNSEKIYTVDKQYLDDLIKAQVDLMMQSAQKSDNK